MESNKNLVKLMKCLLKPSKANSTFQLKDDTKQPSRHLSTINRNLKTTSHQSTKQPKINGQSNNHRGINNQTRSHKTSSHQCMNTKDRTALQSLPTDAASKETNLQDLPTELKLSIFSRLEVPDKVRCQRVCKEWRECIKDRYLWKKIDFSEVIRSYDDCRDGEEGSNEEEQTMEERKACLERYYEREKVRMLGFFQYLNQLKPSPTELRVCLDIGDMQDHWLGTLKNFLDTCNLKNLKRAYINWKETPWKPFSDSSYTWSNSNYSDLIYRHRRRQRHFVSFFDTFTAQAKSLEYLNIPFDWSASSVAHLCRLGGSLKELVLTEYFVPQSFQQSLLDKMLSSLTNLEKLTINIVFGSGLGLVAYQFNSQSLKYLNLSKCKGITISKVDMPRLEVLFAGNITFPSHYLAGFDDSFLLKRVVSTPQRMCQSLSSESFVTSSPSSLTTSSLLRKSLPGSPALLSSSLPDSSFLLHPTTDPYHFPDKPKSLLSNKPVRIEGDKPSSLLLSDEFPNTSSPPCLIDVLKSGAPKLKHLNHYHFTTAKWPTILNSSLNKALFESCFCYVHSSMNLSKNLPS